MLQYEPRVGIPLETQMGADLATHHAWGDEQYGCRVSLFGAVTAWRDGAEIALGGPQPRTVLAALALASPGTLDRASLIDIIWGDALPADPSRDLRRIVHGLRVALGSSTIATHSGGGYRSTIPRGALDAARLDDAVAISRQSGVDHATAIDGLRQALATTTGEPLGGLTANPALSAVARSLSELRITAQDRLAELLLESGDPSNAIMLLEELVSATPLHEDRWALLMTALASAGRRSEALRCYQHARNLLTSTIGVEPGPRLRSIEASILAGSPQNSIRRRSLSLKRPHPAASPTYYVDVEGSSVAYQVRGDGPLNIVLVPQLVSHLEAMLDLPGYRQWIDGIASMGRVAAFDKRGNGMSDRLTCSLTVEERVADISAVMDAAGMERAALVGTSEGATLALRFAALCPDRVTCVVAAGGTGAGRLAAGIISEAMHQATVARVRETWGTSADWWIYELAAPSLRNAPGPLRQQYEQMNRLSCTPNVASQLWDLYGRMDIRPVLGDVRCHVLVQHRASESLAWAADHLLAGLPFAEQTLVPGADHPVWVGDVDTYLEPIRSFLQRQGTSVARG